MPITDRQFREVVEIIESAYMDGRRSIKAEDGDIDSQIYFNDKYLHGFIKHDVRLIFGGERAAGGGK